MPPSRSTALVFRHTDIRHCGNSGNRGTGEVQLRPSVLASIRNNRNPHNPLRAEVPLPLSALSLEKQSSVLVSLFQGSPMQPKGPLRQSALTLAMLPWRLVSVSHHQQHSLLQTAVPLRPSSLFLAVKASLLVHDSHYSLSLRPLALGWLMESSALVSAF